MALDIHYLKTFYHLGLIKNYTETAKRLHITQSAVSHSIKKLELSINVNLIKKNKQKFEFTHYGKRLFKVCENIFTQINHIEEILKIKAYNKEVAITIGAPIEFGSTFLINSMQDFISKNNNFHIDYKFHDSVFDKLLKNEMDFVIDSKPHFDDSTEAIFLCDEPYCIIATPKYAKENSIKTIKDFSKAKILSLDPSGVWWERFLCAAIKKQRISLGKLISINHIRGIINGVLSEMGIGLVPKYTVEKELKDGSLIEIFTEIEIRVDIFKIYIKKENLKLKKNVILIEYLKDKLQNR